jgi:alpha-L-rhamnosidase
VPVFGDPDDPRYLPIGSRGTRFAGIEDGRAVFTVGPGEWEFTARLPEPAPDPEPFVVIDAPTEVALYDGEQRSFPVTLRNLEDERATVEPTVSAGEGWSATVQPTRLSIPAGGTATVQVAVSTESPDRPPGRVTLEVAGREAAIGVLNTDNAARVATMSASSTYGHFSAARTNDGDVVPMTDFGKWDAGGGWNDNTLSEFPDTLTATWSTPKRIARVKLFTLDSDGFPAERYGVRDYDVEALVDGTWSTVASVRGNTEGVSEASFDAVTADALRLVVLDSNSHDYARVIEVEAYAE